jgi:hypothetical protein
MLQSSTLLIGHDAAFLTGQPSARYAAVTTILASRREPGLDRVAISTS